MCIDSNSSKQVSRGGTVKDIKYSGVVMPKFQDHLSSSRGEPILLIILHIICTETNQHCMYFPGVEGS